MELHKCRDYRDLVLWQRAMELAVEVHVATLKLPRHELFVADGTDSPIGGFDSLEYRRGIGPARDAGVHRIPAHHPRLAV